jgi:hypothetical protein
MIKVKQDAENGSGDKGGAWRPGEARLGCEICRPGAWRGTVARGAAASV